MEKALSVSAKWSFKIMAEEKTSFNNDIIRDSVSISVYSPLITPLKRFVRVAKGFIWLERSHVGRE